MVKYFSRTYGNTVAVTATTQIGYRFGRTLLRRCRGWSKSTRNHGHWFSNVAMLSGTRVQHNAQVYQLSERVDDEVVYTRGLVVKTSHFNRVSRMRRHFTRQQQQLGRLLMSLLHAPPPSTVTQQRQVVNVIRHKAASSQHTDGSVIFARWHQRAPHLVHLSRKPHPIPLLSLLSRFSISTAGHVLTCPAPAIFALKIAASRVWIWSASKHGSLSPPESTSQTVLPSV